MFLYIRLVEVIFVSRPRTTIKAVCQNEKCSHYLMEDGKNIIKRGFNRAGHRQYFCFNCNKYFVETKGTPLYQSKLKERKIKAICKELVQKKGMRCVSRDLHVNKNTVCKLLNKLGEHAHLLTNYLVHNLGLSAYEVDELWTFIKKNKRNLSKNAIASLTRAKQLSQHV
jgi:transposase-like protein